MDGKGASAHEVGVDHGGFDILVAQEFLDGADIVAGLQKVGSEGVAENVGCDVAWMTFAVIEDRPLDPIHVGLLIPFAANDLTNLFEKFGLSGLSGVHSP